MILRPSKNNWTNIYFTLQRIQVKYQKRENTNVLVDEKASESMF